MGYTRLRRFQRLSGSLFRYNKLVLERHSIHKAPAKNTLGAPYILMTKPMTNATPKVNIQQLRKVLLFWYDANKRDLPWRSHRSTPYQIWLSEIMLQQTTVVTVIPYFNEFIRRWPKVENLATADLDEVLHAWQGLGYYARARNLHACAKVISSKHNGRFPDTVGELLSLPGIGPYTASAIGAIAFGRPVVPVDGNVERVMARLHAVTQPLSSAKKLLAEEAGAFASDHRPADLAQALMELGALVCRPTSPECGECPWSQDCRARQTNQQQTYPVRNPKKTKPTRQGVVFWVRNKDGSIMLRRRVEKGLLGGMMEFPSTEWQEMLPGKTTIISSAPLACEWTVVPGRVRHTFTHFHLELTAWLGEADGEITEGVVWVTPDQFSDFALPTLMKKVARHVEGSNKDEKQ